MLPGSSRRKPLIAVLFTAAGACGAAVEAARYRPTDDRMVLGRVPGRPAGPVQRELRELHQAHAAAHADPGPAVELARRYFSLARETGDLRYVGYAEAALSTWRQPDAAPIDVAVIQAQLAQYRHDFTAALKLLDSVIARDAGNV